MSILRLQLPGHEIPDGLANVFAFVEHGVGFVNDGRYDGVFAGEEELNRSKQREQRFFLFFSASVRSCQSSAFDFLAHGDGGGLFAAADASAC